MKIDSKEKYDRLQVKRRLSRKRKGHSKLCIKTMARFFDRTVEPCNKWHHPNDLMPVFGTSQLPPNHKSRSVNIKKVFGGKVS